MNQGYPFRSGMEKSRLDVREYIQIAEEAHRVGDKISAHLMIEKLYAFYDGKFYAEGN